MPEHEKRVKWPDKVLEIVKILELNEEIQKHQVKGFKILTPSPMPSRLPIFLAQLKSINNSENLKTKLGNYCILCTDEKPTKNIYKSLINIIQTWEQSLWTLNIIRQMSLTNLFISLLTNLILKLQITKILDWLI